MPGEHLHREIPDRLALRKGKAPHLRGCEFDVAFHLRRDVARAPLDLRFD